jgi:hypothetical protein
VLVANRYQIICRALNITMNLILANVDGAAKI